jgi:hypothetical protein
MVGHEAVAVNRQRKPGSGFLKNFAEQFEGRGCKEELAVVASKRDVV